MVRIQTGPFLLSNKQSRYIRGYRLSSMTDDRPDGSLHRGRCLWSCNWKGWNRCPRTTSTTHRHLKTSNSIKNVSTNRQAPTLWQVTLRSSHFATDNFMLVKSVGRSGRSLWPVNQSINQSINKWFIIHFGQSKESITTPYKLEIAISSNPHN